MINDQINTLPNTSPVTLKKLKSLEITTYWDLINYLPLRYESFQTISRISEVQNGELVTIIGTIIESQYQVTRTGLKIQKFLIEDKTGTIDASWYNQPYLLSLLHKGQRIAVAGEIKKFGKKYSIQPKGYEILINNDLSQLKHTARLVPIYSEKQSLSSKTLREKIWYSLKNYADTIQEYLPKKLIQSNDLIEEKTAYKSIHFPISKTNEVQARNRLAFDELFLIQLSSRLIREEWEKELVGSPFSINDFQKQIDNFIKKLPFTLTKSQKKSTEEIISDLNKTKPMNRLLQGDVGSGKTVVAAIACYLAYLNGYQSLIMAPTEILAEQHFQTITKLFDFKTKAKFSNKLQICLVTSSHKPSEEKITNADIVIGTHALIQKKQKYRNIGLVIIDEQHRFGVIQRAQLKNKAINPHLLTMTATPIPRTAMLTIYGELDISVINEMPSNRLPVKTYLIPEEKRIACYQWIKKQISIYKIQAYIVCPLIEESQIETISSVKAATKEYEHLKKDVFPDLKVGLLHGKLKSKEKQEIMKKFNSNKLNILVTTSVVEVGVDIPNSTIMIIEGAERFGLAQLHQLRGRVGRGDKQSYCFVFPSDSIAKENFERLNFFSKTNRGNELAEKDLSIRGPGNLFGMQQHGYLDLKAASLTDFELINKTKKAVDEFTKDYSIKKFPILLSRIKLYQNRLIAKD